MRLKSSDLDSLNAGTELNMLVHRTTFKGDNAHWKQKIPNYSGNPLIAIKLLEMKRKEKKYFEVSSTKDGYYVTYDYGRDMRRGNTFAEALAKAVVADWMKQKNISSVVVPLNKLLS